MTPTDTAANRAHIWLFLALAFALSWAVWVPAWLASLDLCCAAFKTPVVGLVGALGPGGAALLAAGLTQGRRGLGDLLGRLRVWRVGLGWYAFVALLGPAVLGVVYLVYGVPETAPLRSVTLGSLAVTVLIQTLNTLAEELGWRGYLLPRLRVRLTWLAAAALFGPIHTLWHLPYWLSGSMAQAGGWGTLALSAVIVLAGALVFTFVYERTGGSVLLAWLLHLAMNASAATMPTSPEVYGGRLGPLALYALLWTLVAAALVALDQRRALAAAPA